MNQKGFAPVIVIVVVIIVSGLGVVGYKSLSTSQTATPVSTESTINTPSITPTTTNPFQKFIKNLTQNSSTPTPSSTSQTNTSSTNNRQSATNSNNNTPGNTTSPKPTQAPSSSLKPSATKTPFPTITPSATTSLTSTPQPETEQPRTFRLTAYNQFTRNASGEVTVLVTKRYSDGFIDFTTSGKFYNLKQNTIYQVWHCDKATGSCSANNYPPIRTDNNGDVTFSGITNGHNQGRYPVDEIRVYDVSSPASDTNSCVMVTNQSPSCISGTVYPRY